MKVAILDDYQNVALQLADWSAVRQHAEITVFNDHLADPAAVVARLRPFEVVCVMRERTPLTREILRQLPNLKLIASTGPRNASIDTKATADLGIAVTATGYDSTATIEFTWSLILASMRGIDREEPLPPDHPFRKLENVLATPHIGNVTEDLLSDLLRPRRGPHREMARGQRSVGIAICGEQSSHRHEVHET